MKSNAILKESQSSRYWLPSGICRAHRRKLISVVYAIWSTVSILTA